MPNTNARIHFDMPVRADAPRRFRIAGAAGRSERRGSLHPHEFRSSARAAAAALHLPRFSPVALSLALVITLAVAYVALIATVMSYAALTVSFSQSVRSMEGEVATLESEYFAAVSSVADTDYASKGYEKPAGETYVSAARATALR